FFAVEDAHHRLILHREFHVHFQWTPEFDKKRTGSVVSKRNCAGYALALQCAEFHQAAARGVNLGENLRDGEILFCSRGGGSRLQRKEGEGNENGGECREAILAGLRSG